MFGKEKYIFLAAFLTVALISKEWSKQEGLRMAETYVAHIREKTGEIQTVKEHCENTANRSRKTAVSFMKSVAYDTGLLHDIGKYQEDFQRKISGEKLSVEHSLCGAIEAHELWKGAVGWMMVYCIAGHHSGLTDGGTKYDTEDMTTLYGRLRRESQDYSAYRQELHLLPVDEKAIAEYLDDKQETDLQKRKENIVDRFAFLTRYLFSCLTDADSLDTAAFCNGYKDPAWNADFAAALENVREKQKGFRCVTPLQKSRGMIQKQAYDNAAKRAEIYLLNMPTGSGKTLCSVQIALDKLIREGKKRIIYVIPYNSIIDQTAEVFESIFGSDIDILRHQSSFSYEDDPDVNEDYREQAKNAIENWDAPFIITTAVQLFESIFADKRGKLRKLHNLADSILVFDEAHLMPQKYFQPCLQAVAYIARYLNSEVLFLTATMPDYERMIRQYALKDSAIVDLITDRTLFPMFAKCRYTYERDRMPKELLEEARQNASSLIVVNTRKSAQSLYRILENSRGVRYHLSTYMTAYDRRKRIAEIREALAELEQDYPILEDVPDFRRITVISTSLIEAGVDLDFQAVYRELDGLDNILQAGGRCNREGKRTDALVTVFKLKEEKAGQSNEKRNLTLGLLNKYDDIMSPECIREYYDRLYFMNSDKMEENTIHRWCNDIRCIPFRTYAEQFRIIDSHTVSLVVPRDDLSRELIEELRITGIGKVRKLRKYACSIYQNELDDLIKQHAVDDYGTGIWCLTNPDYYDENLGIQFEACDYFL